MCHRPRVGLLAAATGALLLASPAAIHSCAPVQRMPWRFGIASECGRELATNCRPKSAGIYADLDREGVVAADLLLGLVGRLIGHRRCRDGTGAPRVTRDCW